MATVPPAILEELYAAPPSAFTRERNARVAALKKAGRHEVAEAVRRLRRPNATLWATNQLGRLDARRLAAFVEAVDQLRRTQLRDPRAAGEALRRQRAELDALLETARRHLADNGLTAGPEALRRVSSTLQGAAVDRELADDLRHGRLTEELSAPGFEAFAGARPGRLRVVRGGKADAPTPSGRRDDTERATRDTERTARAERAAREAEQRRRREEADREQAREAEERERAAREQKAAANQAEKEVEELAARLAEARRRLSETRRGAKAAEAAARKTRRRRARA